MSNGNKKKSKRKFIIFGGIFLLIVLIGVLVWSGRNKENIISVQTEQAQRRTITEVVAATGNISPVDEVEITPEVSGEIVELPVEDGQRVKRGDLLIRIKPQIYEAQKARAQASLTSAEATLKVREANFNKIKADFERIKELVNKKLASSAELEAAEAEYLTSKGNMEAQKAAVVQAMESLKEAEEELAKTAIYSPLNGVVTTLNVELGERVLGSNFTQGTSIMTVADLSKMEAIVEVDENDVVKVSLGDTARVEVDAFGDNKFIGTVTQIGNSALTAGLGTQDEVVNFEVKILLESPDGSIRPGMSCDADIETDTRYNALSVPIQSVTARMPGLDKEEAKDLKEDENKDTTNNTVDAKNNKPVEVVFVADGNEAKIVYVKTGISDDTYMEITEGLQDSVNVISGPYRAISKELEHKTKIMVQGKNNFGNKGE